MSFPCSSNHINLSNLPVFLCQANNFTDLWQAKLMFSLFARRPPELQNLLAPSLFVRCSFLVRFLAAAMHTSNRIIRDATGGNNRSGSATS